MSDRKLATLVKRIFRLIHQLYRSLSKGFVTWLLRSAFMLNRRRPAQAGFVLPTTVFLILVVTLTTGALTYRAFNNSSRTIGNVQSREIYNAATPSIDRARAKIESLFADDRYPGGVPSEAFLTTMMLNEARTIKNTTPAVPKPTDAYTLTGERRIDANGDGTVDNAWIYHDNDAKATIVYSIAFSTPPATANLDGSQRLLQLNETQKARGADDPLAGPYVRNNPLSNSTGASCRIQGSSVEGGWLQDETDTSKLRKRFQVDAFVIRDDAVKPGRPASFTTLEFAQDRVLERGNKWGAWFRNDLEIHPGPTFNWNGAMHTEGSLMIGGGTSGRFNSYLISSPRSCFFLPETNSEISVRRVGNGTTFNGVVAAGQINTNAYSGRSYGMHYYNGNQQVVGVDMGTGNDLSNGTKLPIDISLDPVLIQTQDGYRARDGGNNANTLDNIANNAYVNGKRFVIDDAGTRPYTDDLYRADNRYGPRPNYQQITVPAGQIGADITGNDELTREVAAGGEQEPGLDGYWERRAIRDGLRILVGERLELGNPAGWVPPKNRSDAALTDTQINTQLAATGPYPAGVNGEFGDVNQLRVVNTYAAVAGGANQTTADAITSDIQGDPLYPPQRFNDTTRAHEARQRRQLRDNLSAVQSTAIYHTAINGGTYPAACLATTAHPGTAKTIENSTNFTNPIQPNTPWIDFFYGTGTNGWEFAPPPEGELSAGPMRTALQNLANFAGDPDGAYPPQQGARVRPDPIVTMWGNFSNLRRALGSSYDSLSPADKTYLQTAGCTLGMLAYNINQVQQFNPSTVSSADANRLRLLGQDIFDLMDGDASNGEVITPPPSPYNPRAYDNVTPAQLLAALKTKLQNSLGAGVPIEQDTDAYRKYLLAVLIHENFQIRRDRTYGFRPSPAANTWNHNPYVLRPTAATADRYTLWSSACDPNMFKIRNGGAGSTPGETGALTLIETATVLQSRLGLSRLCGTVIPPGAVHDGKGDTNFPARKNRTFTDPNNRYVPQLTNPNDVNEDNPTFNTGPLATATTDVDNQLRAQVLPEFPSLYYIFPEIAHNREGSDTPLNPVDIRQPGTNGLTSLNVAFQPWNEPYITNPTVRAALAADQFTPVSAGTVSGTDGTGVGADYTAGVNMLPNGGDPNITAFTYFAYSPFRTGADRVVDLGMTPKPVGTWTIPTGTSAINNTIKDNQGRDLGIAFLDKVLFDGREWLPSRVLDLDLDMLRRSSPGAEESWLPKSGIVYAFREDARREDAIARPAGGAQTNAMTPRNPALGVAGETETDPPLAAGTVSTKPVDFVPDPGRRVHGFRLRNGDRLERLAGGIPERDNIRGLSFFSDDVVYIQGNFNRHQTAGDQPLEEFLELLDGPYDATEFYGRTNVDTQNFAKPTRDGWRPSEIYADTVNILSDAFRDGSVAESFTNTSAPVAPQANATSFLNQNRPDTALNNNFQFLREIPGDEKSPIRVSRNGDPLIVPKSDVSGVPPLPLPVEYAGRYNGGGTTFDGRYRYISGGSADNQQDDRTVSPAENTSVNAIMISGIVPSRLNQGYGGLHNFPRFLEWWENRDLRIAGSFLQLNFSNYATGPYDQDAWEPTQNSNGNEVIDYYGFAPNRLWGYDVALQMVPAGPAAARFVQLSSVRNEYYDEPPTNDAYMRNLCAAAKTNPAPGGVDLSTLNCPA